MIAGPKIRVLVADDHPVFRDGIRAIVNAESDLEVVAEASDGRDAVAKFKEHRPEVVLMDLRMPGLEGADAIAAILRVAPDARILVLTTFDGDEDIHRALRLGAKAYLLKDAFREEILEAIRAVHAGKKYIPPAVAACLAERPIGRDLTVREIDVLELIAQGLSNKEIGGSLEISEATVKSHVNSILAKLGAPDRTSAALMGMRRGLIR
ncbi:MAG: response regulator transcription factor [Acidobacteria bacterium]|nr:response regulator transcription factor [Acidobacteriota bacterium]